VSKENQMLSQNDADIRAIVFDLDGLLIDSERVSKECWAKAGFALGVDVESLYDHVIGKGTIYSDNYLVSFFGDTFPIKEFRVLKDKLFEDELAAGHVPLQPGAKEVLIAARELHKKTALATGSLRETAQRRLAAHDLASLFDALVFGDEVEKGKPDPALFLLAAERLGVSPEQCLVLEDSIPGVKAAVAAGMRVGMVVDLTSPDDYVMSLGIPVYDSLEQLLALWTQPMRR
jgi:HAD superfamily hydrolase (TIGR01509 family)